MNVFTVLALLAGLVLIANTMTTLIGEQRREIGMMKAIGGTRRQIRARLPAHRAAARSGRLGDRRRARPRWSRTRSSASSARASSRSRPASRSSVPVVVASVVVGLVAPPLAALPAIRRGSRIPVREGLEEVPALEGGQAVLDRRCAGSRFLPRTAQIGIRSVTRRGAAQPHHRRRRSRSPSERCSRCSRSINSVTATTNAVWNQARWDVELDTRRRHAARRARRPADPHDAGRRAGAADARRT